MTRVHKRVVTLTFAAKIRPQTGKKKSPKIGLLIVSTVATVIAFLRVLLAALQVVSLALPFRLLSSLRPLQLYV